MRKRGEAGGIDADLQDQQSVGEEAGHVGEVGIAEKKPVIQK
ncbi:hypothetical protein A2U01_0016765, partial [Trifolium medium]|nr:hypothetical protein [Trifolium medium]